MATPAVRAAVAAVLLALASVAPARAGTFLFLRGEPGDYVVGGTPYRFTPADGPFTATRNFHGGVSVSFNVSDFSHFWYLDFAAPGGVPLTPGAYEGATRFPFQGPGEAGLSLAGDGRGCNMLTGRFVVLEVVYGVGDEILSFAADFEQHCEGGSPAAFGSVRYRAGSAACGAAPDGTACDDRDACTGGETCQGGACTASAPPACGDAPDQCEAAGLCDPTSGACAEGRMPDGTTCNDASACTLGDRCQLGQCVGDVLSCDDSNVCTEDGCGAALGCTHAPLPCWTLRGRATVTASAQGRTVTQSERFSGLVLLLREDGTYVQPTTLSTCAIALPDELGTYRPGRRGRLVLETSNLDAITDALSACFGYRLRVRRYRVWVKVAPDGQSLRGRATLTGTVRVRGVTVFVSGVSTFRGTRTAGAPGPLDATKSLAGLVTKTAAALAVD